MLTKSDLQKIRQLVFEENSSLKQEFGSLKQEFNNLKREVKNDILTFKDEILGEIKGLRQEVTIVTGYKDQIEDRQNRIEKLEKAVFP